MLRNPYKSILTSNLKAPDNSAFNPTSAKHGTVAFIRSVDRDLTPKYNVV